jgi:predicted NUDIX family NTP pyrophosphohydrolase
MYRRKEGVLNVLLVHPGGPFWARKDAASWSIPKGEFDSDEEAWDAAIREFQEEIGIRPTGTPIDLGEVVQPGRKRVTAFALEGDVDVSQITSCTFELEWPPKSGRIQAFPEVDRAEWFDLATAAEKMLVGQRPFLDRLAERLRETKTPGDEGR